MNPIPPPYDDVLRHDDLSEAELDQERRDYAALDRGLGDLIDEHVPRGGARRDPDPATPEERRERLLDQLGETPAMGSVLNRLNEIAAERSGEPVGPEDLSDVYVLVEQTVEIHDAAERDPIERMEAEETGLDRRLDEHQPPPPPPPGPAATGARAPRPRSREQRPRGRGRRSQRATRAGPDDPDLSDRPPPGGEAGHDVGSRYPGGRPRLAQPVQLQKMASRPSS